MAELVPVEFWNFLTTNAKVDYPELLFIAEVYQMDSYRRFLTDGGFDLLYDKSGLYDTLRAVTCGYESARGITANWQRLGDLQPRMLNFLENHDEQRIASPEFAGSPENGYAALAVSALFYPTAFMLYFGQELGEDAADGNSGRTSIFSHCAPIRTTKLTDAQKSTLAVYKEVLALKKKLGDAPNFDLSYCQSALEGFDPDKHFAFLRKGAKQDVLVVCNFSHERANLLVTIPSEADSRFVGKEMVNIGPMDFIILKK